MSLDHQTITTVVRTSRRLAVVAACLPDPAYPLKNKNSHVTDLVLANLYLIIKRGLFMLVRCFFCCRKPLRFPVTNPQYKFK